VESWSCRIQSTSWASVSSLQSVSKLAFDYMRYPIAIEPRTKQTAYGVVIPDLPGCFSAGDTLEEAIAGAEEAGLAWIEAALDAGDSIPPPASLEAIRAKPEFAGWILSLVTIDPAGLDDTIARVNITLPRRVLRRLDDEARAAGETRSGYIAKLAIER
jgi:predicted RNase H-like HicB family nuclease